MDLSPDEIAHVYTQGPAAVAALVTTLLDQVAQQQQTITTLTARVQHLEEQLGRNSRNSHQPPSSDGLKKPLRSLRQRSGRRPGGQPGHPGQTLRFSPCPDEVVRHRPSACAGCDRLLDDQPAHACAARQVVDLPPLTLHTVEHQVETLACPACGQLTSGQFPPEAPDAVQYGPRLKALLVYLRCVQLLPSARTRAVLHDLFGVAPGEGTIAAVVQHTASTLAPVVECIRAALHAAGLAHFDETGLYVEDYRAWLHTACTRLLTYYYWHPKRGYAGMSAAGVLPGFTGVAVHDAYASYWRYDCPHALCGAHLLRELQALVEQEPAGWAAAMQALLRQMLARVQAAVAAGCPTLGAAEVTGWVDAYRQVVAAGLAAHPAVAPASGRGRGKQSKAHNLLVRLQSREAEVLRFVHDLRVPFDNNQAERDLRMMKVQQKISGRFRSAAGATAFCQIRSYTSTLRKQGVALLEALEQTLRGTPLLPVTTG